MKKRLLALLLCLVMVIGLVPVALADGGQTPEPKITYTIKVDANGGALDGAAEFTLPKGSKIPEPVAYKYGYYVSNWTWNYEGEANQGNWDFRWTLDQNGGTVVLHAVWAESTYSIAFNANGGEGTMNTISNIKIADETTLPTKTTLTPNAFTRTGYTFKGWSTSRTGIVEYADGAEVQFATAENGDTITLYAVWEENGQEEPESKFELKYVDSTGKFSYTPTAAASYTVEGYPAGWTIPAGKEFDCWEYRSENKSSSVAVGTTLHLTKDTVLYPTFKDKTTTYKVIYDDFELWRPVEKKFNVNTDIMIDPNGGKVSYKLATNAAATQITKEETIFVTADITLAGVSRTGYNFEGWNYNETTRTFTAVWAKPKYNVTFYCYNHGKTETKEFTYNWVIKIDPNGGTYDGAKWFLLRDDCTIADPTRTGYKFYGWVIDDSVPGTYTFTAVWNNNYYYNSYSIYYYDFDDCKSEYANFPYGTSVVIDPNGGTAKLSGTSFSTKQSFNIYRDYTLTDASRSGYTFYGWDLTKSGSTYYFTAMWSRYKSDVPYMLNGTDHYAYIKGYPNGSFKPTDTITRAEAATIFYRLLTDATRKAYATTYNSFKDVPATAWYNTAVSTMAKLGIVNGGADGYFRPNDPITRAEIAAMIARCDGAYYTGSSTVFSDTYGHWAAGYIDRAYELGWINGYGTTYAPDRYISRAETVAVLNRVLNRAPQYTSDLTRNYTTFSDVATSAWYYLDVEEAANSHTYTRKSNADYETWTKLIADPSWF